VTATEGAPSRRFITANRVAALLVLGILLAAGAYYLLPEGLVDNAIRLLVAEGILLATGVLVLVGALLVFGFSRRTVVAVLAGLVVLAVAALGVFEPKWRGDMQHDKWALRQWAKNLLRSRGVEFADDVIRPSKIADPPLAITPGADDWPEFLGTTVRNSTAPADHVRLARSWEGRAPREVWRTKVGHGWSSFAVVGRYGFTQEQTTDDAYEQVTCYDMDTGKLEWVHSEPGGYNWQLGGKGPRATPLVRSGKVFAQGSGGVLNCLEAATGKLVWRRDLAADYGTDIAMWGKSTSPLWISTKRHGDLVVVGVGVKEGETGGRSASLVALKPEDGSEVWRGGTFASGYCSPELVTLGGVPQILLAHWQTVAGHDPETGEVLWTFDGWDKGQPKVPQPIVVDDRRVLVSAGYGVGCRMLEVARDDEGRWNVKELWKSMRLKPKFTNLVVRDGFVYGIDDGEFFVCLDLADGKLKWRSPRSAEFGHGQPLLIGDLILIQTEEGELVLAAADPGSYRELGRIRVLPDDTTSWNAPALRGKFIICRNDLEAACFELPTEP
jgi:outer membrane protein assembly factor BamB